MNRDLLFKMLSIHSPSGHEQEMVDFVQQYMEESLGLTVQRDDRNNLYAAVPGQGEPVLLCAHMDTVSNGTAPIPTEEDGVIRAENRAILGLDDKASVFLMLEAVRELQQNPGQGRAVELLFTVDEERGAKGAEYVAQQKMLPIQSKVGVAFDLPKAPGSILAGAAGLWRARLNIHGKSAHAARPQQAHNALRGALRIAEHVLQNNEKEGRRGNVSFMRGGVPEQYNVIPDHTELEIELRSIYGWDPEVEALYQTIDTVQKELALRMDIEEGSKVYAYLHDENDPWLEQLERTLQASGLSPERLAYSMGGSDANPLQAVGINLALLGNGVDKTHGIHEHVHWDDLEKMMRFLRRLLQHGLDAADPR